MSSNVNRLIFSILQFFDDQQREPHLAPDAIESLEVAMQCLESAYNISIRNVDDVASYKLNASLPQVFANGIEKMNLITTLNKCIPQDDKFKAEKSKLEVTDEDKNQAEIIKSDGNEKMKLDSYKEAINCYTEAIRLDPHNTVYYSNRAAAYGKLGDYHNSLEDCQRCLNIDPTYAKAYGRKGLAHSALNKHQEAIECFKKALEFDPTNESYRENLKVAEQAYKTSSTQLPSGLGGMNFGGMDIASLLQNPSLMNMATSMLSNPQMQSMMSSFMSSAGQSEAGPVSMNNLLQAGQQLAQQMQQSNPELVEQLRSQMRPGSSAPDDQPQEKKDQ